MKYRLVEGNGKGSGYHLLAGFNCLDELCYKFNCEGVILIKKVHSLSKVLAQFENWPLNRIVGGQGGKIG